MKRTLLFLSALLMGISGVWADVTVTFVDGTKVPYHTGDHPTNYLGNRSNSSHPNTVTTVADAGLAGTVISAYQIDQADWDSIYSMVLKTKTANSAEKVVLTAPAGYVITGYSFGCYARNSKVYYVDKSETFSDGTKQLVSTDYGSPTSVSVTGLETSSTSFWLSGDNSDWFCFTSLIVTLKNCYSASADGTYYRDYTDLTKQTPYSSGDGYWTGAWLSSDNGPRFAIVSSTDNYISAYSSYLGAKNADVTYTIRAVGPYKIKGYKLKAKAQRDGDNGGDCTITITTPDGTGTEYATSAGKTTMANYTLPTASATTYFTTNAGSTTDGRLKDVELIVDMESNPSGASLISNLGVYNIKFEAGELYYKSPSTITATSASAAKVQLISTGNTNEYYMYSVSDSKFITDANYDTGGNNTACLSLCSSKSEATPFTFAADAIPYIYYIYPTATTKSYYLTAWSGADAANIVNYARSTSLSTWQVIPVSYDSKALITSYMDDSFTTNYNFAGAVGYPTKDSPSYLLLKNLTDSIKNTSLADTWRYNADMYTRLQSYYSSYLAETNITMPEDGKTYAFVNYFVENKLKYLHNNDGSLAVATLTQTIPASAHFVAHKGIDGKYIFVAKETNRHFRIPYNSQYGTNLSMSDGYNTTNSPIEIIKMPKQGTYTDEQFFGTVYLKGTRADGTENGIAIVNYSDDTFNAYHTKPGYSKDNWSTAFIIQKISDAVEVGYNIVNMRQAGTHSYATTYLPLAVRIPAGIKAYKATSEDGTTLTLSKVAEGSDDEDVDTNILPAETAVILWSEKAAVTGNQILPFVSSELIAPESNVLSGTGIDATVPSGKAAYVLSGSEDGAGFFPLDGADLPLYKAYLLMDASEGVRSFSFTFEDVVNAIQNAQLEERMSQGAIYDLSGRRIAKPAQGIYIQNGRKFIIK